jgi:hypothetical protein
MQRYLLEEQEKICAEATELALWTMSERSWSLRLTYQSPPIRYAGAMAANPDVRKQVASQMKAEWMNILRITVLAHTDL